MANVNMSFSGNSHKSKQKPSKVTKGKVSIEEDNKGFWATFFEDDIYDIWEFIKEDVLKPSIKNLVYDVFVGSLDRALFGGGSHRKRRIGERNEVTNYSGRYKYGNNRNSRTDDIGGSITDGFESIKFDFKDDAQKVLDKLRQQIKDYDKATVGDFYDFAGITPDDNYSRNERYGWVDLDEYIRPRIRRGGGYYLPLPHPKAL